MIPVFTWIYPIFPLLSRNQQQELSSFYFSSLRRTLSCLQWKEKNFSSALDELSLEDRCAAYWNRFLSSLSDSIDGQLILEKANICQFRKSWLDSEFSIQCLRRSKRFVSHVSILEKAVLWLASVPQNSSVPDFEKSEIDLLLFFPESFC